jgi:hypothetical protein
LWPVVFLAVFFCFYAIQVFRRRAGEMVDEL